MREIKFRGKSIKTNEWHYGNLIIDTWGDSNNKTIFGILSERTAPAFVEDWCPERVDENTISEFTGLYDKNGKEIYENDIVKAKYIEKRDFCGIKYDNEMEFNELVVWKYQAFQLEIDNCGIKMYRYLNFYENLNNIKLKELEVIGNIFENKELLGEKQ